MNYSGAKPKYQFWLDPKHLIVASGRRMSKKKMLKDKNKRNTCSSNMLTFEFLYIVSYMEKYDVISMFLIATYKW